MRGKSLFIKTICLVLSVVLCAGSLTAAAATAGDSFETVSFKNSDGAEKASKELLLELGTAIVEALEESDEVFTAYEAVSYSHGYETNDKCNGCFKADEGTWHKYIYADKELCRVAEVFFGTASRMVISEPVKATASWSNPYQQTSTILRSALEEYRNSYISGLSDEEISAEIDALNAEGNKEKAKIIESGIVPKTVIDCFREIFYWEHFGSPFDSFKGDGGYTFFSPTVNEYDSQDEALPEIGKSYIHIFETDENILTGEYRISYDTHRTNNRDHWSYAFNSAIKVEKKSGNLLSTEGTSVSENYFCAMDGSVGTVWTADFEGYACLNWITDKPAALTGYRIVCTDNKESNPESWLIEASTGNGQWTLIDKVGGADITGEKDFTTASGREYTEYRIVFTGTKGNGAMKIAEITPSYQSDAAVKNTVPENPSDDEAESLTVIEKILNYFRDLFDKFLSLLKI